MKETTLGTLAYMGNNTTFDLTDIWFERCEIDSPDAGCASMVGFLNIVTHFMLH